MIPARLRLRAAYGLLLVLGVLGVLLVRLGSIQLGDHGRWEDSAQRQHYTRVETLPAERGAIVDRHLRVLARTERFPSVAVDPALLGEGEAALASLLQRDLGVRPEELRAALRRGRRFAYLRRHVADRAAVARLREEVAARGIRGVVFLEEPRRVHPAGLLAAHVVGFTDTDGRGLEGAERIFDRALAGRPGRRVTLRDASGRRIVTANLPCEPPVDGRDVVLTIDAVVQTFAEEAVQETFERHRPKGAVAAVVDVRTGELLALATRPTFDPDAAGASPPDARRNRFFTDSFEPGSTFKPLVMGAALDAGVVTASDTFDCGGGTFRIGRRSIREDEHKDYGTLTASGVIARSSNVGMAQVGLRLGIDRTLAAVERFGFGARTAVGWPGESRGRITPRRSWTEAYTLCSVSFGHEIAVTPAQLLQSYAAVANGGLRRPLRLFADSAPGDAAVALSEAAARALTPMMEEVLTTGTARRARISEYRVAGKTGTAQKLVDGAVVGHVASFACFGPAEEPRLAVLVLLDEPKRASYGSVVAAPYATDVLRRSLRYLGVPPSASPGEEVSPR